MQEASSLEIALVLDPSPRDEQAIFDGLLDFNNHNAARPTDQQPFAVLVKDPVSGETLGGLTGKVMFDWVYINLVHLPEHLRGSGLGSRVMQRAEAFARERGLVGIWLDTFAFQARGFYEKLGYEVFGELRDFPRGSSRFFLSKRL
jgi:GNAT superfamily N-acetyltransferase